MHRAVVEGTALVLRKLTSSLTSDSVPGIQQDNAYVHDIHEWQMNCTLKHKCKKYFRAETVKLNCLRDYPITANEYKVAYFSVAF